MNTYASVILGVILALYPARAAAQAVPDLSPLDAILEQASQELSTDLELVVLHRDKVVYRKATEGRGGVGTLAIASASKWLAAGVLQSMVDEGLVSWDDPVGLHLYYWREDKAAITLRQIFSHTAGLRSEFPCLQDRGETIDNCVQTIAASPLLYPPGTAFHYGDASFQVGARVAETVSSRFWEDLFRQRIAQPLGMHFTTFQPDGPTINPDVSAGVFSNTEDYLRFLRMIAAGGEWEGRQVLSRRGVNRMLADQTLGVRIASSLYGAEETLRPGAPRNRYGFGNWLEGMADGVSDANSSQGAFGVSPYVDRRRQLAFLVFLRGPALRFNRFYYEIQDLLNAAFPLPAAVLTGELEEVGYLDPGDPPSTTVGSAILRRSHRYVPEACGTQGADCPGLIALHPDGSDGAAFAERLALVELAEREGLVVEMPDGLPVSGPGGTAGDSGKRAWDLTSDFGSSFENDAGFPVAVHESLARLAGVDPSRIYLLGEAEGATVASLAACRGAGRFAGLVLLRPVAALSSTGLDAPGRWTCPAALGMPVQIWDFPEPPVPAATGSEMPAIEDVSLALAGFWTSRNGCTADDTQTVAATGYSLRIRAHNGCRAGTAVSLVTRNGTTAPPNPAPFAWEFLRSHVRSPLRLSGMEATNAASYLRRELAPGSLVSLFGTGLAAETTSATGPVLLPSLGGIRVEIRDRQGTTRAAPLVFVSPGQVNLLLPEGLAPGMASLFLYRGLGLTHRDWVELQPARPGLFAADATGAGAIAGEVLYVHADGSRQVQALASAVALPGGRFRFEPASVDLAEPATQVFLTLYGTGWSGLPPGSVKVRIGDRLFEPAYAGRQGVFAGLDQVNVRIDDRFEGPGEPLEAGVLPLTVETPQGVSNRLALRLVRSPAGE